MDKLYNSLSGLEKIRHSLDRWYLFLIATLLSLGRQKAQWQ